MNQSELGTQTCNRRQARENALKSSHALVSFAPDWLKKEHVYSDWLRQVPLIKQLRSLST